MPEESGHDLTRQKEVEKWCMWAHGSALLGFVVPFGNVIGPWYILRKKGEIYPEVVPHAKAALNFQLTMTLYVAISLVLLLVWIGLFFLIALMVYQMLSILLAVLEAHDLEVYRYPLGQTFIK